jgi:hypothetical protein
MLYVIMSATMPTLIIALNAVTEPILTRLNNAVKMMLSIIELTGTL